MAFFDWSDGLSVNVKEIDAQHRQFVELLNELYESMKNGHGTVVLGKILDGMVEYAETHFPIEEQYLARHKYPGYSEQKMAHEDFTAKIADLLERYKKDPNVLSVETGKFLKNWLAQHIMGADKLYGPFLNDRGVY